MKELRRKESPLLDCSWCGSARSIEFGICQVCLMEYPLETKVIHLPLDRPDRRSKLITIDDGGLAGKQLAEKQPS